ncbi:MAG: helix-turn-helix domain-containing protein [Chloroflexi bacterium]|nr:helix-turn-helix domain-containing protein [Chloroflexota bacterium]
MRIALPTGARMVAGEAGLGREVTWVTTLKSRAPGFDALTGGELALISTGVLTHLSDQLTLPRIVQELSDAGVAAMAIVGEVETAAIGVADQLGMPLIALPEAASLVELERSLLAFIRNRRAQVQQQEGEIHQRLTQIALEGQGLSAIVKGLAELRGKWAILQDENFNVQFAFPASSGSPRLIEIETVQPYLGPEGALQGWLTSLSLETSTLSTLKARLPVHGLARVVIPIHLRGQLQGYLSLLGLEEELDELDRLALQRAAELSALELAKELAILEAEARMRGTFLADVLLGNYSSEETILVQGRHLGYDFSRPYVAVTFGIDLWQNHNDRGVSRQPRITNAERIRAALASAITHYQPTAILKTEPQGVTALWPVELPFAPERVKSRVAQLRPSADRAQGVTFSLGIGRYHPDLKGLQRSYHEAQQALQIGQRLFGPGRVTYFGDLGVYRLLAPLKGSPELRDFYQEVLAGLAEYDTRTKSELVKTLQAFFECGGNLSRTAASLHVHRNTLAYRLSRIGEITGLDLDDAEHRFALQLAIKVKDTL